MLGYSECSKGYRVYNIESNIVEESIHVKFDDRLDLEKSKLDEKFEDLKIIFSNSEDVHSINRVTSNKICEIMNSPKRHALGFLYFIMGLCRHHGVDIIDHHHFRQVANLNKLLTERYCTGCREITPYHLHKSHLLYLLSFNMEQSALIAWIILW